MPTIQDFFNIADEKHAELRDIALYIHSHPELGFQEKLASAKLAEFLSANGFDVEKPLCGYDTALRARAVCNNGNDAPPVCVVGEYDALEILGHACGHNLIATAALSAAWTAKSFAERNGIPLNLCFMGTPAEEQFGGKAKLLQAGAFKDIQLAIMAHGSGCTETDEGALGAAKAYITFHGRASHAAQAPEKGINALDALFYFYQHMLEWKATISPRERVHGIITNGGQAANIIPELTQAFFYVRSPEFERLAILKAKLEESAKYGAAKVGATVEVEWHTQDDPVKVNPPLNERYAHYWHEAGKDIVINTGNECRASTDMGNVTQVIPGAQFRFSVNHESPCPLHSIAFREAASTDWAIDSAIHTGAVMARILTDFSVDEAFRNAVKAAWK